jgi:hypothetical protein
MTGVLEHIYDFSTVLPIVTSLLKDSGTLMIAVPDAANFSSKPLSPFDEFSVEHINYFTKRSLANLMSKFHLKLGLSQSISAPFYDSTLLVSFYNKSQTDRTLKRDSTGISRIKRYINSCAKKLKYLDREFEKLIKTDKSIVVWGVGSLTYRLLASTNLSSVNIRVFVDSNQSLQGKKIRNTRIFSPNYFDNLKRGTVFIASHIYGDEIEHILRNTYRFEGNIIRV